MSGKDSEFDPDLRVKLFAGLALGLLVGAALAWTEFPAAGNDDSHITHWSAHALAKYGAILNYNGEHVEQSSSLLLVLVLAGLNKLLALPIPATAWALGVLAAAGTVVIATKLTLGIERSVAPFTPIIAATSLPFAYWATSGMETALFALLGCAVVEVLGEGIDAARLRFERRSALELALLFAFVLVRPEAPLVLLCTLAGTSALYAYLALVLGRDSAKPRLFATLVRLGAAVVVVLVVALGRYAAFHAFVPNSAAAKVGGFELSAGAAYLFKAFEKMDYTLGVFGLVGAVICIAQALRGEGSSRGPLLVAWTLAMLSFVISSGGDWMPAARLVAPLLPGLAVLAALVLSSTPAFTAKPLSPLVVWGFAFLLVGSNVRSELKFGRSRENGSFSGAEAHAGADALIGPAERDFAFTELGNKAHRRDARLLGVLLDRLAKLAPSPEHPLYIMSGQAGMVPYYAFSEHYGALKFIDLFAITTRDILPCVPDDKQRSGIHGIKLDPSYIIDRANEMPATCGARRPDIVFSTGRFPHYLAERGYENVYQGPHELEAYIAVARRP
jgi:hypothetical protein